MGRPNDSELILSMLNEFINRRLTSFGWSQRLLARNSALPEETISRIISGVRKPTPEHLDRLAIGLKLDADATKDIHRLGARANGFKF